MKVYISVDIEGITGVTSWSETTLGNPEHRWAAEQMINETIAACEGAIEMGATEIVVKDAHDSGRNMDISRFPKEVKVIRGWTNSPESMMAGIDKRFDAAIFIGYHSGAGQNGNPLSHTMNNEKGVYIKINDQLASEFTMNAYIAAYYGVPVVLMSGDKMLCEQSKELISSIETVAVKEGIGGATVNINPQDACEAIKEGVKKGLKKTKECKLESPKEFNLEIRFREHKDANRASYYPGVSRVDDYSIKFLAKDIQEMMTAQMFML